MNTIKRPTLCVVAGPNGSGKTSTTLQLLANEWAEDRSIENASLAVEFVDRAYIYDNSVEDHIPQILYRTMNGKIVKRYTKFVPDWAKQIIDQSKS